MDEKTKEKVMRQINSLQNMIPEKGATEGEITASALAIKRLLAKHSLTMAECDGYKIEENIDTYSIETDKAKPFHYQTIFALNIASSFDCTLLTQNYWDVASFRSKKKFIFIGESKEAEVACYFYAITYPMIFDMATNLSQIRGLTGTAIKRYRHSFIIEASKRIRKRLQTDKEVLSTNTETRTGTSLVKLKKDAVERFIKNAFENTTDKKVTSDTRFSVTGEIDGREAGDNISLHKGVEQQETRQSRLLV